MLKRLLVSHAVLLMLTLAFPWDAWAQTTYTWTGAAGDDLWATPDNWDPTGVPGSEDTALIGSGAFVIAEGDLTLGTVEVSGESTLTTMGTISVLGPLTTRLGSTLDVAGDTLALLGGGQSGAALTVQNLAALRIARGSFSMVGFELIGTSSLEVMPEATAELFAAVQLDGASARAGGELASFINNGTTRKTGDGVWQMFGTGFFVENNGALDIAGGALAFFNDRVTNTGLITGNAALYVDPTTLFTNTGRLAPGAVGATGTFSVASDFPLEAPARLEIELAGPQRLDMLAVDSTVTLGGELAVGLVGGFTPALGQAFEVLTFGERVGEFSTYTGLDLGGGLALEPAYTDTSLVLTVVGGLEVAFPEEIPVGSDLGVTVNVGGFVPTVAELRYRADGARAFASVPLEASGEDFTAAIPAEAVTIRGVAFYVFFSDGEQTLTYPPLDPETNPAHLRVRVPQQVADIAIPSDAAYRMVSVPAVLSDPRPESVFGDDYGAYGVTSWRLLRWLPAEERYAELVVPDSLDTPALEAPVVPGTAFWLAAYTDSEGPAFDVEDVLSVDASMPATVTLEPGWNQIGNPFAFPVEWAAVVGSEMVQPPALFDGTEYLLAREILDPWAGYFVFNPTAMAVTLAVPPTEALALARPTAAGAEGYRLRLSADVPERELRDTQNVFGFAESAEAERLSLAEPPPIGPHVRLSAVEDGERLAHSFRPAGGDGGDWELEVTATPDLLRSGPLTVRVTLEEAGARPTGFGLYLLDLDRTAPIPLPEGTFDVTLRADAPLRRFRLIAGTEAYADAVRQGISLVPLEFALAPAYPNPFTGSATLAFQLAERADVRLDVFDLLGRRVAVLADGVHDAGRYTVRWDGMAAGAPAASGVYVYRLHAGGFTASQKMVLLR